MHCELISQQSRDFSAFENEANIFILRSRNSLRVSKSNQMILFKDLIIKKSI